MHVIKNFMTQLMRYRWWLLVVVFGVVGIYLVFFRTVTQGAVDTYAVIETVERGSVSSGIQTTGTIVAAQKLNLDVYKQARRIEAVHVSNASRVEAGTVLFSFDKSGAYVAVQSSRVSIAEAELALASERASYSDANTTLRTLQNNLVTYQTDIVQAEKDLVEAQRDFYNANKTAEPGNESTVDKTRPTISGVYNGTTQGTYRIEVYRSAADAGYSYRVSGLENDTENYVAGIATALGTRGLKILLPGDIRHGDAWLVSVPNIAASEYVQNRLAYESTVRNLEETIASKKVEIANTEVEIKNQSETDGVPYRDLDVAKAEAALAEANQQLSENYDVVEEQDIIAPFSGTVEGLQNVVVGATPTGNTNDTISLGTLISDKFLVNFSLSAVDVAKVVVGQKVLVSVTSFPGEQPLEARITEVSSLPESEGVAQYEVQALIEQSASSTFTLREGLLAQIEVVQEEVPNVIRVPLSALNYENGTARVRVVGDLTEDQQRQLDTLGVIKSVAGTFPSYAVDVTVGVTGSFYAEVTSGLTEGMKIIVTNTEQDTSVIEQDNFGPPRQREGDTEGANSAPQ